MSHSDIHSEVVGPNRRVRIISETAESVPNFLDDTTAKIAFSILQDVVHAIRRDNENGEDIYGLQRYGSALSHVLKEAYPSTTSQWWVDQAKATLDHEDYDLICAMDGPGWN